MRSRINGLNRAMSSVDDRIGLTNVGEGALVGVHGMLYHMRTLAVEAANEAYHTATRRSLEVGRRELLAEIDRIGSTTDFGGVSLFSQAASTLAGYPRSRVEIMRSPCRSAPQGQRP